MLAALHSVLLATLGLSPSPLVGRRTALASAAAAVLCRDLCAARGAIAATYGGGRPSRCDSIFAGTFTDPINHPGGIREITLNADGMGGRDATVMGRRLATVAGGGGRGEPERFRLEALVDGDDGGITIDFTPKGGPDNFRGRFEAGGDGEGIRFVKDKNFWPKVKACTPLPPCSSGVTPCA
mmetsp:Transcript_31055/g.99319  ORF Transcript_31055/g.99319 Transcript_31055/m.99319 type:complete len:182 (+) Transcript_31055:68-613(+)